MPPCSSALPLLLVATLGLVAAHVRADAAQQALAQGDLDAVESELGQRDDAEARLLRAQVNVSAARALRFTAFKTLGVTKAFLRLQDQCLLTAVAVLVGAGQTRVRAI